MSSKRKEMAENLRNKTEGERKGNKAHDALWESHTDNFDDENTNVNTSENKNDVAINNDSQTQNNSLDEEPKDLTQLADTIVKKRPKQKKLKFEDTHTKDTFYVKNDILKAINRLANKQKGEKTRIVNEALYDYIIKMSKEYYNEDS
ncbi:hypothetical protein [Salibacterium aidingense]|uniref:hypothetical protein n=1 Tax=Salibacterium aidingense TaxID=384933 RepID=UPI00042494D2|nr:hypothetical protein [Salibacterium aidingense]